MTAFNRRDFVMLGLACLPVIVLPDLRKSLPPGSYYFEDLDWLQIGEREWHWNVERQAWLTFQRGIAQDGQRYYIGEPEFVLDEVRPIYDRFG